MPSLASPPRPRVLGPDPRISASGQPLGLVKDAATILIFPSPLSFIALSKLPIDVLGNSLQPSALLLLILQCHTTYPVFLVPILPLASGRRISIYSRPQAQVFLCQGPNNFCCCSCWHHLSLLFNAFQNLLHPAPFAVRQHCSGCQCQFTLSQACRMWTWSRFLSGRKVLLRGRLVW